MPNLTRDITHNSDLSKKILQELRLRVNYWDRKVSEKSGKWREAENKVLAFVPDTEVTRKRKTARDAGLPDYTTIQIPYSYAVVMSALTYITSVFLGRSPVFQYTGRHGEAQQQVQAMEALIDYQLFNGYMLPYFYTWIYDALKYGYGITGVYWEEKIEVVSSVVEEDEFDEMGLATGKKKKVQVPELFRTYAGNRLYNIQPQDFIWDARLPVREFQKGEFAGRRFAMGWNEVQRKVKMGFYNDNVRFIKERDRDYYTRDTGSSQLARPDWFSTDGTTSEEITGLGLQHPMVVYGYELVVEIIPREWGLSESTYPEKYVFTCTSDFNVLFGISPLGAKHCSYPFGVIPLEPEGYGLTTRGLPEILDPVQNTIDWLLNSHFYNIRAALNNKFVVDPSKLVMKDVLDPLPGGIIRLKPGAYGTDTKTPMTQMQVNDVTQNHLTNFQMMIGIGERVGGVNDQIMGMLDTGGRKTATEVRTSTSFGINRLKTMAEFASASAVDPLSKMLVQNTQQYYDMELKFKIAGDLAMGAGRNFMVVTPDTIAGFYDFVPVDGTLPIDRFAQVNLWKELMAGAVQIPTIGAQYDFSGIFEWIAQLAGLKNITQFKVELMPDQKLALLAQQGNSIAVPPRGGAGPRQRGGKQSDTRGTGLALPPPGGGAGQGAPMMQ
jgi:hypothetical protein